MQKFSVFAIVVLGAYFYVCGNARPTVTDLPTISQLRNYLEKHPHIDGHPEIILAAAEPIAKVFELGKTSRANRNYAVSYFKSCSERESIIPAVRSVCHSRYLLLVSTDFKGS